MERAVDFLDVLRIRPDEIRTLLTRLDAREAANADTGQRSSPRFVYPGHPILLVQIEYPTSDTGAYRAVSRNISATGLGFLHGKFVYPRSPCRIILPRSDGSEAMVDAIVARCEHLSGRVHDVGVSFTHPLDLSSFALGPEFDAATDHESGDAAEPAR
ncbi:MAG: hypothetical protein HKO59_03255 [Phycisphaerales bacterium]|nr:PilZ domain-containing protein [Phycisphaerae bacterium]NNM24999.1 hypothetical protein [Phycisphaerales bacterium]